MVKQKTKKRKSSGKVPTAKRGKRFPVAVVLAVIGGAIAALLLLSLGKQAEEPRQKEKATSFAPTSVSESRWDLEKLIGRWRRPDGGYIIEVRRIRANGRLDAGYFNPRPINISRAEALHRGDEVRVFIELQDAGYPGSTYTLTYDPPRDVLTGVYFHAGLSQTFDVVFVRTQ